MADKGWQRKFENPIPLPDGRKLVTFQDAADYITLCGLLVAQSRATSLLFSGCSSANQCRK